MIDPKAILDQFLGANVPGTSGSVRDNAGKVQDMARNNPMAAGAIVAVLLGTKTGRSVAGSALKLGGLAAIAGLGYQAWKNYQEGANPAETGVPRQPEVLPPPAGTGFAIEETGNGDFTLALVRIMIAAARADGHVDATERQRILDKLAVSGIGSDAALFIEKELTDPVDLDGLVGSAKTEAQRVELYTAARLAIEPDTRAERGFLDLLAGRLGLADALVDHIEATVSAAKV